MATSFILARDHLSVRLHHPRRDVACETAWLYWGSNDGSLKTSLSSSDSTTAPKTRTASRKSADLDIHGRLPYRDERRRGVWYQPRVIPGSSTWRYLRDQHSLRGSPACSCMTRMRGGTVLILVGIVAVTAFSVGRQNAPAITVVPVPSTSVVAKPITLIAPPAVAPIPVLTSSNPPPPVKVALPDKPVPQDNKRKVEVVLTVAAIAAIIIQASRDQYHAGGRPCACPDDTMRNGRACGGRSAYLRPGGAAPLCYPTDVSAAMIDSYRQRQASR